LAAIIGRLLAEKELEHTLAVFLCATQKRLGGCSMDGQPNIETESCPPTEESVVAEARQVFEELVHFCQAEELTFGEFEKRLLVLLFGLGRVLTRLMLVDRHLRLDLGPYHAIKDYRSGNGYAKRKLKTVFGEIVYGRAHFIPVGGGTGFHPLDVALGLTRDGFSPWMVQFVTRLATRMSYAASRMICQAVLGWSPSTEAIEHLVLGLGRQAAPFMQQLAAPPDDGEVLVIEVDGKCPPTATEQELSKRRGKREHPKGCSCGCQRHRGQAKRKRRGQKRRRKKGDKSKNGKEVMVVVMYTLRRGRDDKLHGPINKKTWATFGGRKAAVSWAREEATKRGFGPNTTKTVQIVVDGAKGLKEKLKPLFPEAIITLDVCHVVEKLWELGHRFHKEGSEELNAWVEDLKELVYQGRVAKLVERLKTLSKQVPMHGPGTKGRRQALKKLIGYLEPRLEMMRYREWIEQDLVIASGQVEGAVRHVVGERMDCAGMRWIPERAEALLHLRCIELNGDWEEFIAWAYQRYQEQLHGRQAVQIRTDQPMELPRAA
jgi:hypothetical protein